MNRNPLIGIFIYVLLIITTIIPVSGTTVSEKTSQSLTMGNILYVGGSGPNNYTKIQDAIDNASDGDTVFVYSGFYFESITIEKSIMLIGEDKNETVVEGKNLSGYLVRVKDSDGITIRGFTFNNSYNGIYMINSDFSNITDCIIFSSNVSKVDYGIYCETSKHIIINNNEILNFSYCGIGFARCSNCLVTHNTIMNCALYAYGTGVFNKYTYNTITNTTNAVVIDDFFSLIEGNTIKNNVRGILLIEGFGNKIVRNNFISNSYYNAVIETQFLIKTLLGFNKWDRNYCDDSHGYIKFIPCYYLTHGYPSNEIYLPLTLNIDWHPSQKPYDISIE